MLRLLKSVFGRFNALPFAGKLGIFCILFFAADLWISLPLTITQRFVLFSFICGAVVGGGAMRMLGYSKKLENLQKQEERLLQAIDRSLDNLSASFDDAYDSEEGTIADIDDETSIVLPDCALVVGKGMDDSYIIPFSGELPSKVSTRDLDMAVEMMKQNGVKIRVLRPKQSRNTIKQRISRGKWMPEHPNLSINFPQNFVSLN